MKITILTMFPQLFEGFVLSPVVQRAVRKEVLELEIVDIKEYAPGSFRHIDDSPFGGGAGMVSGLRQPAACHRPSLSR